MPGNYLDCGCFISPQSHLTRCPANNAQVELDMAQESLNTSLPHQPQPGPAPPSCSAGRRPGNTTQGRPTMSERQTEPQITRTDITQKSEPVSPTSLQELAGQWRTTWEGHWQSIKDRDFPQPLISHAADTTTQDDTPDYGPNALRLQGTIADVIISPTPRNWAFVEEVLPKGCNTTNDFWQQLEGLLSP